MTLMTAYYFVYKIVLSIETNLDVSDIDVRIDVTKYEDKSQFEIDFSRNINHERCDMINIVHDIMLLLDCSNFVLDYLFYLLPNFEFQKPITPSLDTIFDIADDLVKNTFFVAAKTDGLRRLVIIINHLMFSVSENFEVEYIDCINSDLHLVFDCEFVNDDFIPFDILYHNVDFKIKDHKVEHIRVYKIKTRNTVDLRFDGRYFYAKQHSIKKSNLKLTLAEFKKICLKYHQYKKLNCDKNKSIMYYHKKVDIINDTPFNKRIVYYQLMKEKKIPFIIEFDLDKGVYVKEREDNIVLASFQKINIEIFSPDSNTLMRKYHNRIKHNIFNEYKGNLLDIGSGNGGDIHKWKYFRKIACVEPDNTPLILLHAFFALNDFNYSDVESMLNHISKNINGMFIVLFMDNSLFNEHYENAINSEKVLKIFEKYKFNIVSQYSIKPFSFLNPSQNLYTSYLKVIKFSHTND
ncbi:hypothetical protein U3516DRAFT_848793 [Neocallimastix sp. 'constans']